MLSFRGRGAAGAYVLVHDSNACTQELQLTQRRNLCQIPVHPLPAARGALPKLTLELT